MGWKTRWSQGVLPQVRQTHRAWRFFVRPAQGRGPQGTWCIGVEVSIIMAGACEFWLETVALACCTDPWLISPL